MLDCSYKRLVEEKVLRNISSDSIFANLGTYEIVSRVLGLESLVYTSDFLYKCVIFKVYCKNESEVKVLESLVSLSEDLKCEYSGKADGRFFCNISHVKGDTSRAFRDLLIEILSKCDESFVQDEDLGGYLYRMLNSVCDVFFNDLQITHRELDSYLRNRVVDFSVLNLGVLSKETRHLEVSYKGLEDLSETTFQIDLRDFENVFSYLVDRYGADSLVYTFDYSNVLNLVDILYTGTWYSDLLRTVTLKGVLKLLGTKSFYRDKDYNQSVYNSLLRDKMSTFRLQVSLRDV